MKKRALSLLMAVLMVVGLLPATTRAAGEDITVSMTVYDAGQLANDRDGKAMLQRDVTVNDSDGDGTFTLDEALKAVHAEYCTGGGESYGTSNGQYGTSVTKLWGAETGSVGFYKNDVITGTVDVETVTDGDRITAFIYYDKANWSDRYSFFNVKEKTVEVEEEFSLTLNSWGYDDFYQTIMKPVVAAPLGIFNKETGEYSVPVEFRGEKNSSTFYMPIVSTGTKGDVKFSITKPGVYYVTAQADSGNYSTYNDTLGSLPNYLVPPLCIVTVLSEEDYAAYENQRILDDAKAQLTWTSMSSQNQNEVTAAPNIPSALQVGDKTVSASWESDSAALSVSNYYGSWSAYVDRPAAQDAQVTLTATLTYEPESGDAVTDTVELHLTVKAEGVNSDKTSVVDFKALMDGIAGTYTSSTDAWTVLDMAGYGKNIKGTDYGYSSAVSVFLAERALGGEVSADTLKNIDLSGSSAIYSIPYILLAYDAAKVEEDDTFTNTREGIKGQLVSYLNALDTNYAGVDEVAPVLTALAGYYGKGDSDLDAAVEKGISWLSAQQKDSGAFAYYGTENANSSAMVVVALSALGIDAHRDTRFIKNSHSAMEGLMSFALPSNDGFGYKGNVTENGLATEQGFRALVSYARFAEKKGAYNIYMEAKVGAEAPADPAITATVKPTHSSSGDKNKTIAVTVTVNGNSGRWLCETVSVKSGSSVYDVLRKALTENGYILEGNRDYIRSITTPDGVSLGEYSTGKNSGWLYKVDGVLSQESVGEYTLTSNSQVLLYYTDDWTKDPDAGNMGKPEERPNDTFPFLDVVDTSWYYAAVKYAYEHKLFGGTSATEFSPEATMTRGMAATILYSLEGSPAVSGKSPFSDVADGQWYAKAVTWAEENGIVGGIDSESFAPEAGVTREQLAAILYRYAQYKKYSVSVGEDTNILSYEDALQISTYAVSAIQWACGSGLMTGRTQTALAPVGTVTRAEVAVMLQRFCEKNIK